MPTALRRALLPAAHTCQEAKLCSRGQFGASGCSLLSWPSRTNPNLCWWDNSFDRQWAGTPLAPPHTPWAPPGLTGRCKVHGEGMSLHTRQVMCKMCSPPAKICCLQYGLSMLLYINSECEYPACPSVPKGFFLLLCVKNFSPNLLQQHKPHR